MGGIAMSFGATAASRGDQADVYISVSGENRVARYVLDRETGELRHVDDTATAGAPGSIGVNSTRTRLYVALRSIESVAAVHRDPKTGRLKVAGETKVAGNPVYVTPDRTDQFLLTAYYSGDKTAVFRLGADGNVEPDAVQILDTGKNPHSIGTDPSNRFVFTPNTGADLILQHRLDPATGKLIPSDPDRIQTAPRSGPRHFCFHPKLDIVYVVNEIDSTLSVFSLNTKNGTLKSLQTLPTTPEDFTGRNTCADIHVTPDGRFVYGSNRGHDSLAGYRVDEKTGLLTSIGQFPTEKTPREFAIDSTGRFVVSAGQDSGKIVTYRLDLDTGKLDPIHTQTVGKSPAWVLILDRE